MSPEISNLESVLLKVVKGQHKGKKKKLGQILSSSSHLQIPVKPMESLWKYLKGTLGPVQKLY